jgi:hypothetical protein
VLPGPESERDEGDFEEIEILAEALPQAAESHQQNF